MVGPGVGHVSWEEYVPNQCMAWGCQGRDVGLEAASSTQWMLGLLLVGRWSPLWFTVLPCRERFPITCEDGRQPFILKPIYSLGSNLRIYSFLCFGIGDFPTANDCRAFSADDPVWSLLHHLRLGALHALRQGQKLDRELDEKLDWSAGNVCERFESCELNILLVPGKTNLSWDWVLTISCRMGMVWDKACQPCQTCGFLGGYEDIK